MYIPRTLSDRIQKLATFYPAIILTGARQTGKTTLIKKLFPTFKYVSLDLPSRAEQAEHNPEDFLLTYPPPVIIDEVQYAPGLFRHLKRAIDENRDRKGQFFLTGSQKFPLMKHVSDSLAGRCAVLELETLSLKEISEALDIVISKQFFVSLMARGQFPELWKQPDFPSEEFYASYVSTYLERDVRQIMNVTSLRDFERFIRILSTRNGSMLNKSDVARDTGVSVKAIGDWISILQASGQIVLLEPWFTNISKRLVKTPKLHFCDTGLLCFLLGIHESSLLYSPFLGQIWESFIFSELRKLTAIKGKPDKIWYYRDQLSREIDLIVEREGTLHFMECKWAETPREEDARVMDSICHEIEKNRLPWKPGKKIILAPTQADYTLSDGTIVCSPSRLGHLLEEL